MTNQYVGNTPEQLLLRDEAAQAHPEFATLEGRALKDVQDTLAYIAMGMYPNTVLGGLLHSQYAYFDSTLVAESGRDAIQVGVLGNLDPISPNERGDTVQDILEGLVSLGLVERTCDPFSSEAAANREPDKRFDERPEYRLSTEALPERVQQKVDAAKARYKEISDDNDALEERKRQRKERRQNRRWRRKASN